MADFNISFPLQQTHEGGYGIDNNGYEVYRGINRLYNPTWNGWTVIDVIKGSKANQQNWIDNRVDIYVKPVYKKLYWDFIQGDKIINQTFANFLYDFTTASGADAVKVLQRLLNVRVDGGLGPVTLAALNNELKTNGANLYKDFWKARYDFTKNLVPHIIPQSWWAGVEQRLLSFENSFVDEVLQVAKNTGETVKKNPIKTLVVISLAGYILYKIFN